MMPGGMPDTSALSFGAMKAPQTGLSSQSKKTEKQTQVGQAVPQKISPLRISNLGSSPLFIYTKKALDCSRAFLLTCTMQDYIVMEMARYELIL
jgi:hypothetical protein